MDIERLKKVTTIQEFFQITNKETISDGTKAFLGMCEIFVGAEK